MKGNFFLYNTPCIYQNITNNSNRLLPCNNIYKNNSKIFKKRFYRCLENNKNNYNIGLVPSFKRYKQNNFWSNKKIEFKWKSHRFNKEEEEKVLDNGTTSNDTTVSSTNSNLCFNKEEEEKNKNENEEEYKGNPEFENTVILKVVVKISKDEYSIFKLKRFDDLFETVKLFCEINKIDEKMIKPLIIKSFCAINTIYQVMNCNLNKNHIDIMETIQKKMN